MSLNPHTPLGFPPAASPGHIHQSSDGSIHIYDGRTWSRIPNMTSGREPSSLRGVYRRLLDILDCELVRFSNEDIENLLVKLLSAIAQRLHGVQENDNSTDNDADE